MLHIHETLTTKVSEHLDNLLKVVNDPNTDTLTRELVSEILRQYLGRFLELPTNIQDGILATKKEMEEEEKALKVLKYQRTS